MISKSQEEANEACNSTYTPPEEMLQTVSEGSSRDDDDDDLEKTNECIPVISGHHPSFHFN